MLSVPCTSIVPVEAVESSISTVQGVTGCDVTLTTSDALDGVTEAKIVFCLFTDTLFLATDRSIILRCLSEEERVKLL